MIADNLPERGRQVAYQSGLNHAYAALIAAVLDDMPADQKRRVRESARSIVLKMLEDIDHQSPNFAHFQQGLDFGLNQIDEHSSGP